MDRIKVSEFWSMLEQLDDRAKQQSGEMDKQARFDAIPDEDK